MSVLIGILTTVLVVSNIAINCIPLFIIGLFQMLARGLGLKAADIALARWMDRIIDSYALINRTIFSVFNLTRAKVNFAGDHSLSRQRWYMVVSNHQSWTDILVLQVYLYGRIPPLKFFTKRQLLWLPLLGQAMWLLGFPYVRRMSRAQIEANPELLVVDRKATQGACEKFKDNPSSVLNFLEGTRFTTEKRAAREPRFNHLLNPKSGGLSQVLIALDDRVHKLIDVTIQYPDGVPTFWGFMQGKCPSVEMQIDCLDLPDSLRTSEDEDQFREVTASWVESLWTKKDAQLDAAPATESG